MLRSCRVCISGYVPGFFSKYYSGFTNYLSYLMSEPVIKNGDASVNMSLINGLNLDYSITLSGRSPKAHLYSLSLGYICSVDMYN